MARAEADELLGRSISELIESDYCLLDIDVSERALSHQLACYIAKDINPPLSVDCEYNRHYANPKKLNLGRRRANECYSQRRGVKPPKPTTPQTAPTTRRP